MLTAFDQTPSCKQNCNNQDRDDEYQDHDYGDHEYEDHGIWDHERLDHMNQDQNHQQRPWTVMNIKTKHHFDVYFNDFMLLTHFQMNAP